MDDSSAASDSNAADSAIRKAVDAGWFVLRHHSEFDFEHYWDSVAEMASYLDSRRHRMFVHPSYADLEKVYESLAVSAKGDIRMRCRWRVALNSYIRAQ